jgi:hypothetical protein
VFLGVLRTGDAATKRPSDYEHLSCEPDDWALLEIPSAVSYAVLAIGSRGADGSCGILVAQNFIQADRAAHLFFALWARFVCRL